MDYISVALLSEKRLAVFSKLNRQVFCVLLIGYLVAGSKREI